MWLLVYLASSFARDNTRSRMFATVNVGDHTTISIVSRPASSLVTGYLWIFGNSFIKFAQNGTDDDR